MSFFCYLVMGITAPFRGIHRMSRRVESSSTPQAVISILSAILVIWVVFESMWPLGSLWRWILAIGLCCFFIGIISAIVFGLFEFIIAVLGDITEPAAMLYERCQQKVRDTEEEKQATHDINVGADAEVDIYYFINQEKNKSLYCAKYIGK